MIKGYSHVRYVPAFLLLDLCEEFLQKRKPQMWPGELYPWSQHPDDAPLKEDEWTQELFKVVHNLDLKVGRIRRSTLNSIGPSPANLNCCTLVPHGNVMMWHVSCGDGGRSYDKLVQQEAYHSPYRYLEGEDLLKFEEDVPRPVWTRAQHAQHILHLYNQLHHALDEWGTPHMRYERLCRSSYSGHFSQWLPRLESGPLANIMGFPLLLDPVVQDGIVWDTFRLKDGWHRLTAYLLYNPIASVRVAFRDDTLPWILQSLNELPIFVNPLTTRGDEPLKEWWRRWEERRLEWLTG